MAEEYVQLADRLVTGMWADIDTGWAISGRDVKPVPENKQTKKAIRRALNQGILQEASRAEYDEVHDDSDLLAAANMREKEVDVGFQEGRVQDLARQRRERLDASRAKKAKARAGEEPDEEEEEVEEPDEGDYADMNVDELRDELGARGLQKSGNRETLVKRLQEDDANGS